MFIVALVPIGEAAGEVSWQAVASSLVTVISKESVEVERVRESWLFALTSTESTGAARAERGKFIAKVATIRYVAAKRSNFLLKVNLFMSRFHHPTVFKNNVKH